VRKIAAAAVILAAAAAVAEDRTPPRPDVPAEKFYKNIQVLQGTPSTEIMPTMNFFKASLGVQCSFCHVTNDTGRWPVERDDKAAKGRAREMIRMTREINRANFKGRLEVTCATCHHGSTDPVALPPLLGEAAAAHRESAPAGAPSVDAILEKYVASIGGKDAVAKIASRTMKGTFTGGDGTAHPIEIALTAEGKYRSAVSVEKGAFTMVFDGAAGTTGGPTWNNSMMPDEVERIHERARLFPAADLHARFPALAVRGEESIAGRKAWIVMGRGGSGPRETFWFDQESGLLLRTLILQQTPLGDLPEQTDYSDYREADGVKVPFVVKHTAADRTDTIALSEVKQNVALPPSTFVPPPTT